MLRAGGTFDVAKEGIKQPGRKTIEQSEIIELIAQIGKQSRITQEQTNAYAAAFWVESIEDRNAFFRCSEQDLESIIKKAGMNIGQKNAMIDIWLARESKEDEEALDGAEGLVEVTDA